MNENGLERDDWIVGGLALLLLIDLLFFPWYMVTVSAAEFSVSESFTAIQAPYAWPAILAVLILLALLADLTLQRFAPRATIPAVGDNRRGTRFALAVAATVFLVLKFLMHIHNFGWGFILAVIIAVALIYASLQASRGQSVLPARYG